MDKFKPSPVALLAVAALATVLVYWQGLAGPFLFDDSPNLRHIPLWLDGKLGLSTLLFERGGGTFGRPLSMASFALNAKLLGYAPFTFKIVNLALHLFIGAVVFSLVRRLMQLDAALRPHAAWLACATTALWLLHPLHASTVLYAVQRMAQLSALIVLLGLCFYLHLRQKIAQSGSGYATAGLFLGIPMLAAAAFLAKENGVLLPLLCCVVELSFFLRVDRPRSITGFLWVFGAAPLVAGAAVFLARPERFVAAYAGRDFDPYQRVLSQGRALCDYVSQLVLPNPSRMGIFTDDFAISTGWFDPPTTILAFAALLIASVLAWRLRRHSPTVTFGWAFFLVAHSLEASFVPLELYYEHRNYLPSVGLLAAVVALFALCAARLTQRGVRVDRITKIAVAGTLLVLTVSTHGRAVVWQNSVTIATASLLSHPESINANSYVFAHTITLKDAAAADRILVSMMASERPRNRALAHLYRAYAGCALNGKADARDLETFAELSPPPATIPESQPFYQLYEITGKRRCEGVSDRQIGSAIRRLADRAEHKTHQAVTPLRYQSAAYFARAQAWADAEDQAKQSLQPGTPAIYAVPLVQAYLATGRIALAKQTLQEAKRRSDPTNVSQANLIRQLEQQVELEKSTPKDELAVP
jgi:protein O-mannosyl-transferase